MNIYAEEGAKVKYLAKGGWDSDVLNANKHLVKGNTYTVDYVSVSGWSSEVCLKEVNGRTFNTVMFEDIEGEE